MHTSSLRTTLGRIAATIGLMGLVLGATGCLNSPPKQSGVYVTHDAGTGWTATPDLKAARAKQPRVYPPLSVTAVGVSPRSPKNVAAGTDNDLYQSADGGATWQRLTDKLPTSTKAIVAHQILFHPTDDHTYYVVGVSGGYGKVLKTSDGGKSFQDVFTNSKPGQAVTSIAIQPDSRAVYVGDQLGSVYRSGDGGASWQRVFSLGQVGVSSLTVAGQTLYVGTMGQGIWRSSDNGATFVSATGNLPGLSQTVWSLTGGLGGVYAGTERGLFLTRDSGNTWQSVGNPLPAVGSRVQALAVSGGNLYFATNAVVYRMDPNGTNFVPVQLKLARTVFSLSATPSSPGTLYAGAGAAPLDFSKRYSAGLSNLNLVPPGQ